MDNDGVRPVAEMDVLEFHGPIDFFRMEGRLTLRCLLLLIQKLKHALRGGGRGLQGVGDIGQLGDGLGEACLLYTSC